MKNTVTTQRLLVCSLTLAMLAGCGGSDRSHYPAGSTGAAITTNTTPTPTTPGTTPGTPANTPLVDAHGEVVAEGDALAVRLDGEADAMEIADPSQLKAAKVRVGTTLTFSADVDDNTAGSTSLAKSVLVTNFQADDVATYGRLFDRQGVTHFRSIEGRTYTPTGPLSTALLNHPTGRPVFVSGNRGSLPGDLDVTSWRPTTEIGIRVHGGVFKVDERLTILDLERRGAYVYKSSNALLGNARGSGLLPEADRDFLQSLVVGANLPNQPTTFKPKKGFPVILILTPKIAITGADTTTDVKIAIDPRVKLPAALDSLVDGLKDTMRDTPRVRDLAKGSYSKIKKQTVRTARSSASFKRLWRDHGSSKKAPRVDFKDAFVVGAFRGQTSSKTAAIVVDDVERIGDDLYVTTRKTTRLAVKKPKLFPGINLPFPFLERAPYAIAAVEKKGVKGKIYVDGKRVLTLPNLPFLPKLPKLPFLPKPKPQPKPPFVFPQPKPKPQPPLITLFPPKPKPAPQPAPKVGAGVSVSVGFGTKFKLK